MTTDLFAMVSGIDAEHVLSSFPPMCRRSADRSPPIRVEQGDAVIDGPLWRPRNGARHFLPAVSVLGAPSYSVRFELAVESEGTWSPWVGSATLGPARFPDLPAACSMLRSEIDVFLTECSVERARLRLRVHADSVDRVLAHPWLATLSASDLGPVSNDRRVEGCVDIPVPAWSQMEAPAPLRNRICSPTSLAMVVARWTGSADPLDLAAEVFHQALDLYGVWPAAVCAAGRRGVPGYLLRFPDWEAAAWCLRQGLPIIASLRYGRGELTGAAVEETSGHLLVFTGYRDDLVLVNDPGAPARDTVPRRYQLDEIRRVWLHRAGVGYVFFAPVRDA